ncbi:MAG: hypothetical protein RBG13Loki_2200, partial [Promethearchaeota archaeon CR_4]
YGVAMNATGHVYVADAGNHRVQVFGVPVPTGLSILINGGAAETNTTSVILSLSAFNATEMCFSNDGVTCSAWEPFAITKTWNLASGAGLKTVYFKARNDLTEATPVSDTITYTPPSGGIPGFPVPIFLATAGLITIFFARRARRSTRA